MSKSVDERVVSMQFDNRHFENNVKTSMNTLEKLKQSLNLKDSAKSLENVSNAAKKFDISPMSNGVETVKAKFSALEVIGVTALANITNSAINSAKRIVSSFTIEPIRTGLNEYELKMNSVQTIMMSTGESVEKVNQYLNELNEYSDRTIYSFQDMTANIGKFTNAGVKLEDAVAAIKGISNEAAVSGANANEASRAMYNFSQALSSGYVKLIDWKSIELANMATVEFKQQLIDTAVACGTLTKTADGMYSTGKRNITATKDFNDSLQDQWMTSEVLIETLKKYTDESTEIGQKSYEAAEKVKTFSQMMDVLKETAQSGWAKTWELIFGDLEQAKALFTPLTNFFSGIIQGIDNFRNTILEGALSSPFGKLAEKIANFTTTTGKAVETMQDYGDIVNRVISGEFGEGQARWDKLTEMGYDWAHVQNLVNEKLGNGFRRAVELTDAQKEQTGVTEELTDAKLKELGLTEEEIVLYRDLEKQSKKSGKSISELISEMDQMSGRQLLIESFKNIGNGLVTVFKSIGDAYKSIFTSTAEDKAENIYNVLQKLYEVTNKFANVMKENGEEADKIKRTFAGLFAILDIIRTVVGGGLSIAFKVVKAVLSAFNLDILDVTAAVGDAIVKFRNWLKEHDLITKAVEFLVPILKNAASAIENWAEKNKVFEKGYEAISKFFNGTLDPIKKWISGIKDAENIPEYIISGLINGLKSGVSKVWDTALDIGKAVLDSIKEFLGIHSPSTKFMEVGQNITDGFVIGIQNGASGVVETIKGIGSKIIDVISNIDFGKVITGVFVGSFALLAKGTYDFIHNLSKPLDGLGKMFSSLGGLFDRVGKGVFKTLDGLGKSLKANAWTKKANAIKTFAVAIAILAASVWVLSKISIPDLIKAVVALGVLAAVMAGFAYAIDKIMKERGLIDTAKLSGIILSVGAAMILMAATMKIVGGMDTSSYLKGLGAVVIFSGIVVGLMAATKLATDVEIEYMQKLIKAVGIAMLAMAITMKIVGGMDAGSYAKGLGIIIVFSGIVVGLMAATKLASAKDISKLSSIILSISAAIILMSIAIRLVSGMSVGEIIKGLIVITGFGGIITGLIAATKLAGKKLKQIGPTLLMVSGAILILAGVLWALSELDPKKARKGLVAISVMTGLFAGLLFITKYAKTSKNLMVTLGIMTGVIVVLAGIVAGLSFLPNPDSAINNSIAVGILMEALASAMIIISKAGRISKSVQSTLPMLLGVVTGLAVILGVMSVLNAEASISSAIALGILLNAMAGAIVILDHVGKVSKSSLAAMAILGAVVLELGIILGLMSGFDISPSIETVSALSILLIGMSAACLIISHVPLAGAVEGALCLAAFVGILGALLVALGAIKQIPGIDWLVSEGGALLASIGYALGDFVGSIVGGFGAGMSSGLPEMAENLSGFMEKLTPFIEGAKQLDETLLGNVMNLAKIVLALTGAELLESITSFLTGGSSISDFAEQLVPLGEAMVEFSSIVSGNIDEGAITAAANAGKLLSEMSSNLPNEGGLVSFFTGENNLEEWSAKLKPFGEAMVEFSSIVSGKIDEGAITAAANAGKTLSEMSSNLPNTGGLVSFFTGDNDMETFGEQIADFGSGLADFSDSVSGKIVPEDVEAAADAGSKLAKMADNIPTSGGLFSVFGGDNDLSDFADSVADFGEGISAYSESVDGFDSKTVSSSLEAADDLIDLAASLSENEDAMDIDSDDVESMCEATTAFGSGLKSFSEKVADVDTGVINAVSVASTSYMNIAKALADSSDDISAVAEMEGIKTAGTNIASFGGSIKKFSDKVTGIDTAQLTNAANGFKSVISMAKSASGSDYSGLASFGTSLGKISKSSVDNFILAFSTAGPRINAAGKGMMTNLASGMSSGIPSVTRVSTPLVSNLVNSIKSKSAQFMIVGKLLINKFSQGIKMESTVAMKNMSNVVKLTVNSVKENDYLFSNAGSYVVKGFAKGVDENTYLAEAKARAMAKKAYEAAMKALNAHSPSRLFMKVGSYVPQGFAIGIDNFSGVDKNSAESMAETAVNSTSNVISRIGDLIDSGIDVQPTITPVLDMGSVNASTLALDTSINASISGHFTSLSDMFSGIQKGFETSNNNVVSAICDLRNDINNLQTAVENIKTDVYMDSRKVASSLAKPMNRELSNLARRGGV